MAKQTAAEFKLPTNATKKVIIEKYEALLDAYSAKVKQLAEARKDQKGGARKADEDALTVAADATVGTVVGAIGQLRGMVGQTLNELTDRMTSEAERLEQLKRAVELQERRLTELYELEAAADALDKLATAYDERKTATESEYQLRFAEMERQLTERATELETEHQERLDKLKADIEAQGAAWKDEQAREKARVAEEASTRERERAREEADYVYERDRARKLDEHAHQEKQAAQERELEQLRETAERTLAEREAAVAGREEELAELRKEVEGFPAKLGKEVKRARDEATAEANRGHEHKAALVAVEREWEAKVSQQKIEHLEGVIETQSAKLEQLRQQLAAAEQRVASIAEKAIEGAASSTAFKSVNQIALEQARRPETKGKD